MTMTARIVVVGSSNTDMVVRAPRLPRPGETILGGAFALLPGGKGANQAVAAARLGGDVTLIARVGKDVFGDNAVRGLEAEGIDTRHVARDPDFPTGVALIGVEETTGENSILVAPGANGALNMADVDRAAAVLQGADVVVCQMEVRLDVVIGVLELAHRAGVTTILNPAPATPLPEYAWPYVSVLTPNETEASLLVDGDDSMTPTQQADALRGKGVVSVVMTLGARGAQVVSEAESALVPSFAPDRTVDATAAGDCFTGALAVALAEGRSLRQATMFANAAASLCVEKAGAQPSLPTRAAVDRRLID